MSRKERLERARRGYELKDEVANLFTNANIILVDNVGTTGATSIHISQLLHNDERFCFHFHL
jgi:predicted amidophosphoribosyltransferase